VSSPIFWGFAKIWRAIYPYCVLFNPLYLKSWFFLKLRLYPLFVIPNFNKIVYLFLGSTKSSSREKSRCLFRGGYFVIFGILAIIVIATNYVRNKNTQENIQMESNVTKELNEVQELAESALSFHSDFKSA